VGGGQAQLLQREVFAATFPGLLNAFMLDVAIFLWCAPLIALTGLLIALCRDVRAPALFPLRMFGAALHRHLPRPAGHPRGLPRGLRHPRPRPAAAVEFALHLGLARADPRLFGLRGRGHPLRHRVDPPKPALRRRSLGLSEADTMRFVVLPQAIRNVAPANMNLFIALQKDVALLSFIGPVEIFRQAGVYKSLMANFTPYVGAALIFLAITIPATRYADYLMHKQRRRQR
jgi:polar amino acid transport system permease protein